METETPHDAAASESTTHRDGTCWLSLLLLLLMLLAVLVCGGLFLYELSQHHM